MPQYNWNTAKVSVKHQSINQSYFRNDTTLMIEYTSLHLSIHHLNLLVIHKFIYMVLWFKLFSDNFSFKQFVREQTTHRYVFTLVFCYCKCASMLVLHFTILNVDVCWLQNFPSVNIGCMLFHVSSHYKCLCMVIPAPSHFKCGRMVIHASSIINVYVWWFLHLPILDVDVWWFTHLPIFNNDV